MRKKPKLRFLVPAVILLAVLVYSLTQAIIISLSQAKEQEAFNEMREVADEDASSEQAAPDESRVVNEGLQTLWEQNNDFVGWLSLEDTLIEYPVMKSAEDDPEFYLHRDFEGNASSAGCLFIGEGCDANSDVFIIYGHHMSNDTMFGTLDSYADFDYANTHQTVEFKTPYENRRYRVFAAFPSKVYEDGEEGFRYYDHVGSMSQQAYDEVVQTMRQISEIDIKNAPAYPQQVLLLSTCSYHTDNGRFVVAAYREG